MPSNQAPMSAQMSIPEMSELELGTHMPPPETQHNMIKTTDNIVLGGVEGRGPGLG